MFHDLARDREIPVAIWYPTLETPAMFVYGRVHQGEAAVDAAVAHGGHPLAVISHGSGGNRFNQFYLAEFLARHGYVVAALEHPGNRTFDQADVGTSRNLYNRPRDVSFLIDTLLADQEFAQHIDSQRIVVLGHSVGGFSAIVLGGGRPDLQALRAYCREHPENDVTCPDSTPLRASETAEERSYMLGGISLKDERVRAAIVFAPAIGPLFRAAGLAEVVIPVLVYWSKQDELLKEPTNTSFYLDGLAAGQERAMPAAGHFTFLSVCSELLRSVAPQICEDPEGTDRAEVHRAIEAEVLAFLQRHLSG